MPYVTEHMHGHPARGQWPTTLETMAAQMADQSEATEKETKNARRVTKIVSWSALALAAAAAALNFL